ncbi:MAG TPA: N-acetyltransferase [Caulobacteraceae bacterium]|nr:N-acetyltransferase [Caulobacteraceae bacterium]
MSAAAPQIRSATPEDVAAVRDVVTAAFGQADEADLVEALARDGDAVVSLVAVAGGEVAGHVMLSRMAAPFRALALAPVSVAPGSQNRGIGQALARAALARARQDGWDAVFVLGDPAYYRRFGFDPATAAPFASPYAGEHFMALALRGTLPVASGELRHAPAFGRH